MSRMMIATYTCDLCGRDCGGEDNVTRLGLRQQSHDRDYYVPARLSADVCAECISRPISAMLDFLDRQESAKHLHGNDARLAERLPLDSNGSKV